MAAAADTLRQPRTRAVGCGHERSATDTVQQAKIGILLGSIASGVLGMALLLGASRVNEKRARDAVAMMLLM